MIITTTLVPNNSTLVDEGSVVSLITQVGPTVGSLTTDQLAALNGNANLDATNPVAGLSEVLKLDQSIPQSVEGGSPVFDAMTFNTGATPLAASAGQIQWNPTDSTLDVGLPGGVVGQMFEELFFNGKNLSGSTISDGTPVMFAAPVGASGKVEIQPAIADGSIPSEYVMGIATQSIDNGSSGKITWFGYVRGIDTTGAPYGESWSNGDLIYVSTTSGNLTKVKPNAPNQIILMASVIFSNVSTGILLVRPTWRSKLVDLDDVNGTALTVDGQVPVWHDTEGYFDFDYNINDYLKSSGGTITGYSETLKSASVATSYTPDLSLGNVLELTQTAATEITMPAGPANNVQSFVLSIDAGGFVTTWAASPVIVWLTDSGSPPTFNTTATKINTVSFTWHKGRSVWVGRNAGSEA